jgi:modulator of FtsH protease
MLSLSEWQTFFSVQAECAATLTGLVFVAVSINLTKILVSPGLPGRAAESIAQFLQVFFICSMGLIPGQNAAALGFETVVVVFLCWLLQIFSQVRYSRSRSGHPKWWLIARTLKTHLGSIPLFVASLYLHGGSATGLYWLVPGFLLSFLAGVINAWILLIEINR